MKTQIKVRIIELAGNHPDGFLSKKYGTDLQESVSNRIAAEFPAADIEVVVDTQLRTSGCTPIPEASVTGGDEYEITQRVETLVGYECQSFGEQCMQDDAYFE